MALGISVSEGRFPVVVRGFEDCPTGRWYQNPWPLRCGNRGPYRRPFTIACRSTEISTVVVTSIRGYGILGVVQ